MSEMTMNAETLLIGPLTVNSATMVALIYLLNEMLALPNHWPATNINGDQD